MTEMNFYVNGHFRKKIACIAWNGFKIHIAEDVIFVVNA